MSLFQKSVVEKYLNAQNKQTVLDKWNVYQSHFLNPSIQENIRNSKEEQYQGEFLIDLFVNVLGYTKNPTPNFNLTTEIKNEKDSKKADGGILKHDSNGINPIVIGVIELKGTNTTDLNKIEVQAFGYKNNQKDCVYVITSNFEKLRFYIDNAIENVEFNLFQLTEKDFALLYLCLAYENIVQHLPKKIKEESVNQENQITKSLYKDYSVFKHALFHNLTALNPQYEPLELFKKSQKLLDRFLFLFFAEDRQLLPPNSVRLILDDWKDLQERDVEIPLYDRYKKYFEYLNTGYKGKRYNVFAYNGGLFKSDEILDNIKIDDQLLYNHTIKLATYDFASEVDVNILGHIFENSLNELDEMKAQLDTPSNTSITSITPMGLNPLGYSLENPLENPMGLNPLGYSLGNQLGNPMGLNPLRNPLGNLSISKPISKRKKDGVFYTPKYITKYIVENTVGKLCEEKKVALQFNEEEYTSDRKRTKVTKQPLVDKLTQYRNWLLQITIIDPACGSGAFLNEALNFLIAEHSYIDELQAKLFGDALVLSDVEKSILENNLFGVDLNEESVEIAKLSLWLRTAQPNRKLNDLNNNIKCGNSLIDDPEIAGDKAFNWQNEFPQIFKEKNKKAYHLVFTTHNSRVSQRMIDYKVKKGPSFELELPEEIELTKIFKQIILKNDYKCLAYNICKDHVHLVLVCEEDELSNIAKVLKGKSSYLFQSNGFKPIETPLWSQKYFFAQLDELIWADIATKPGYIATDAYLDNAIAYIKTNRNKHNLPDSKELRSLISDFTLDLDVAFETEYKGGFDVVIGNPPYGAELSSKEWLKYKYSKTSSGNIDSYKYFVQLGVEITKKGGTLSYIMPDSYIEKEYFKDLRIYVSNSFRDIYNVKLGDDVFEEVNLPTAIIILQNKENVNSNFYYLDLSKILSKDKHSKLSNFKEYSTATPKYEDSFIIINSIIKTKNTYSLIDIYNQVMGVKVYQKGKGKPKQTDYELNNDVFISNEISDEFNYKFISQGIKRYDYDSQNEYIKYGEWLAEPRSKEFFDQPKIVIREIINPTIFATYIEEKAVVKNIAAVITEKNSSFPLKYLLPIINSKLINFYVNEQSPKSGNKSYPSFNSKLLKNIPIVDCEKDIKLKFIEISDKIIHLNFDFKLNNQKFQRSIQRKFDLQDLPKKLQDWYNLTYSEFIKELAKKKVKLSLSDEAEWEDYFMQESKKALELKAEIDATDKAIDKMVYDLYELNEEEIAIVENS